MKFPAGALVVLIAAATAPACAGDEVDAVDPVCTQSPYDMCSTEHDCMSELCSGFADLATPVCTAGCNVPEDCPPGDGVTCVDNRCHPAAATVCRRPLTDAGVP